jgi:hypothetical protein
VVYNQAHYGAGIYNQGQLILLRGLIDRNWAVNPRPPSGVPVTPSPCDGWYGGGIFNASYGTISVRGARITRNISLGGAGIYNNGGTVMLEEGSNVSGNTACGSYEGRGGGIYDYYILVRGKVILKANTIVTGNTPDNCYPAIDNCKG